MGCGHCPVPSVPWGTVLGEARPAALWLPFCSTPRPALGLQTLSSQLSRLHCRAGDALPLRGLPCLGPGPLWLLPPANSPPCAWPCREPQTQLGPGFSSKPWAPGALGPSTLWEQLSLSSPTQKSQPGHTDPKPCSVTLEAGAARGLKMGTGSGPSVPRPLQWEARAGAQQGLGRLHCGSGGGEPAPAPGHL